MNNERNVEYAAFLLRVSTGILLFSHGFFLKILEYTPAGTAEYFVSVGYPAFFAYLVIGGEIVAGLLMVAGLWTRWAALAMIPIMLGATWEHIGNGWLFSAPNGGWSFPAFWTVVLAAQILLGDGAFALARRIGGLSKAKLRHA